MNARHDALAAGAQWILVVERIGREQAGLVATVGHIEVSPNISNVIAGEVNLRLDVRHASDAICTAAVRRILGEAESIAAERGLRFEVLWQNDHAGVRFDANWVELMREAVEDSGNPPIELPSGAGHDAAIMAQRFNTAMLFIRCKGGVSHHPDESVTESDVAAALEVLYRFVAKLADRYTGDARPAVVL
jgi:allantoate deiminase